MVRLPRPRGARILAGALVGLLIACASGPPPAAAMPPAIALTGLTLSWSPPTQRTDGAPLAAAELAAHRVLCEPGLDTYVPMPATSWPVLSGIESCVVRAIDTGGLESADSIRVAIPGLPPPGQVSNPRWGVERLGPQPEPPAVSTPTPIGSPVFVTASFNESTSITVPEGATLMVVHAHGWNNSVPLTGFSASIASESITQLAFQSASGDANAVWVGAAAAPEAGSRTLEWAWTPQRADYGALLAIQFFGGDGLTIADASIGATTGGSIERTVDTAPDDYVSALACGESTPAISNLTSLGTSTAGGQQGRLAAGIADDTSLTATATAGYASLSMIAIRGAAAGGTTVEAGLETGAEAGAGFDARVVSRADISAATSAGSTHGASSTIRAAITEGATAQQVASGVASMAAQLAESTLAGAEVTARAALAASITESAGAGEAVSRQAATLEQMIAAAEADSLLSSYLQAVAALAAGVEAGDAWAARLTAAATFSGAAEASGTFSEDSVAQIAEESQAGAQFAAAVHALAEQLEGATAGATMAGIVSTLAAFSSASSAGAVFESAMRHADALQAGAEAGAAFSGITGELTGHLLGAVSAAMVVNSAHQARATWSAGALAGASFVASGDVSALIGALAFVVAAEQRVFTVPAETRTFIVS